LTELRQANGINGNKLLFKFVILSEAPRWRDAQSKDQRPALRSLGMSEPPHDHCGDQLLIQVLV
jgi:hypothetical protein